MARDARRDAPILLHARLALRQKLIELGAKLEPTRKRQGDRRNDETDGEHGERTTRLKPHEGFTKAQRELFQRFDAFSNGPSSAEVVTA